MICATCGRRLAPASAVCPSCGMPASETPSMPVHLAVTPAPAEPAPGGALPEPRSVIELGFLEWVRPGAGLRAIGHARLGRYVRIGTLLGTFALVLGLYWYAGFSRVFGLSFLPAPPPRTLESGAFLVAFLVAFGLEVGWLLVRTVWIVRLVARQEPARPRSARVLTRAEVAASVRALRVISVIALVPFVFVATLYLVALAVPEAGSRSAGVFQYVLVLGVVIGFVAALIGSRDMMRVRAGIWLMIGVALFLLTLVLDALLVPFLLQSPSDLSLIDPVRALLPAVIPLLTLGYAIYSIGQRPLVQPTGS